MSNFENLFQEFGRNSKLETRGTLKALLQDTAVNIITDPVTEQVVREGDFGQFIVIGKGESSLLVGISPKFSEKLNNNEYGLKHLLEAPIYSGENEGRKFLRIGMNAGTQGKALSLADLMKLIETPATVA